VRLVGATSLRFFSASIFTLSKLLKDASSFCTVSSTLSTEAVQTLAKEGQHVESTPRNPWNEDKE